MKHRFIKYEKLSNQIKNEINEYHKEVLQSKNDASFDESMSRWFAGQFDDWLIKNFDKTRKLSGRKHFRLDVEIPIRIIETLIESACDDTNAFEFVGKIVNISRGGLYFKYKKPIEISSIIKVFIDFTDVDRDLREVEALAMVVRSEKIKNEYGIGIMFSSIYGDNKEKLDLFILKNLSYYIYTDSRA